MTYLEEFDGDDQYTFSQLVAHVLGKNCLAFIDKS